MTWAAAGGANGKGARQAAAGGANGKGARQAAAGGAKPPNWFTGTSC